MKTSIVIVFWVMIASCAWGQCLQNGDFETLKGEGQDGFAYWWMDPIGGGISDDAHSGKHALSVWNWYVWVAGKACYSDEKTALGCMGIPTKVAPHKLSGWYKYDYGLNLGGADSAICQVLLSIDTDEATDTIFFTEYLFGPSAVYAPFTIDFPVIERVGKGALLSITFLSGQHGNCGPENQSQCLYLTIDDLVLDCGTKRSDKLDK